MRICFLTSSFLPKTGGMELYVHRLANALCDLNEDVTVIAPEYNKLGYKFINLNIKYNLLTYPLPPRGKRVVLPLMLILYIIRLRNTFDIMNCQFSYPTGYYVTKTRKFLNGKIIVTLHAEDIYKDAEIEYGIRLNSKIERKVSYSLKNCDHVICVSESVKSAAMDLLDISSKVSVIPAGADDNFFNREMHSRCYSKRCCFHVLSVGRNHPKKSFGHLIKALGLVKKKMEDIKIKLWIVGREADLLRPLIQSLGLEYAVHLTGEIQSVEEVVSIYYNSDVFVLPSKIEGLPQVLTEAIASGLPIITTNVPGNRDLVMDGFNGFLYEYGDIERLAELIISLAKDDRLRESLSRNSKMLAPKYHYSYIAQQHVKLYESLLS